MPTICICFHIRLCEYRKCFDAALNRTSTDNTELNHYYIHKHLELLVLYLFENMKFSFRIIVFSDMYV